MKISQYLELPKKMRDARLKAGLSQQFIAKKLGISQQSYARYENGIADPTIETLEIFCREVHMTIPELLGIIDPLTEREPITTFSEWIYVLNELENHGIKINYDVEDVRLGYMTGVYKIEQTQIGTIALLLKNMHNELDTSQISEEGYQRKIKEMIESFNVPISEYIDAPHIEEKKSLLNTIKNAISNDDD